MFYEGFCVFNVDFKEHLETYYLKYINSLRCNHRCITTLHNNILKSKTTEKMLLALVVKAQSWSKNVANSVQILPELMKCLNKWWTMMHRHLRNQTKQLCVSYLAMFIKILKTVKHIENSLTASEIFWWHNLIITTCILKVY